MKNVYNEDIEGFSMANIFLLSICFLFTGRAAQAFVPSQVDVGAIRVLMADAHDVDSGDEEEKDKDQQTPAG